MISSIVVFASLFPFFRATGVTLAASDARRIIGDRCRMTRVLVACPLVWLVMLFNLVECAVLLVLFMSSL